MNRPHERPHVTGSATAALLLALAIGVYLALLSPVFAMVWFSLVTTAVAASLRYGARARNAGVVVAVSVTLATTPTAHLGERDRREVSAMAAVRMIQVGELVYASAYGGYFDTIGCLISASCGPGVRRSPFLDSEFAATERRGYRFEFHEGPRLSSATAEPRSPSAMAHFAVVAIPVGDLAPQGRAFCGDDTGTIYVVEGGTVPKVEGGRCLDTDNVIR